MLAPKLKQLIVDENILNKFKQRQQMAFYLKSNQIFFRIMKIDACVLFCPEAIHTLWNFPFYSHGFYIEGAQAQFLNWALKKTPTFHQIADCETRAKIFTDISFKQTVNCWVNVYEFWVGVLFLGCTYIGLDYVGWVLFMFMIDSVYSNMFSYRNLRKLPKL